MGILAAGLTAAACGSAVTDAGLVSSTPAAGSAAVSSASAADPSVRPSAAPASATASSGSAAGPSAAPEPGCAPEDLQAVLPQSPTHWVRIAPPTALNPVTVFCSGDWAAVYAGDGQVSDGQTYEFEVTVLLHRTGGGWQVTDRTRPCADHTVPPAIYSPACETN